MSQPFHRWYLLTHSRGQCNIFPNNLWHIGRNVRFCKKLGSLVSLFSKCPIRLKVPVTLADITAETGQLPRCGRAHEKDQGQCLSPGCGERGELTAPWKTQTQPPAQQLLSARRTHREVPTQEETRVGPKCNNQSLVCGEKTPSEDDSNLFLSTFWLTRSEQDTRVM